MAEQNPNSKPTISKTSLWRVGSIVLSIFFILVTIWFLVSSYGPVGYLSRIIETMSAGKHPDPSSGRPGSPIKYSLHASLAPALSGPEPGVYWYCPNSKPRTIDWPEVIFNSIPALFIKGISWTLSGIINIYLLFKILIAGIKANIKEIEDRLPAAATLVGIWIFTAFMFFVFPMLLPC
jgi:hypothetical protein